MAARRLIVLFVALLIAGGTAFYARSWMEGQRRDVPQAAAEPAPPATIEYREVLVAMRNLPPGSFVTPTNVEWRRWPTGTIPETYVVQGDRDMEGMLGAVVRRGIAEGEPITDGGVVQPGERGFLAAVLEPGMRAVSVPVNDASSNAGLIFPGDKVDLILTQTLAGPDRARRLVSETVLEDVRVIAMGRRTSDQSGTDVTSDGRARTTTLEVTPAQAELVAVVNALGQLSMSLRSLATEDETGAVAAVEPRIEPITWDFEASRARQGRNSTSASMRVMRGGQSQTVRLQEGLVDLEPTTAEDTFDLDAGDD
jgi:pilus assembly protein CpaB